MAIAKVRYQSTDGKMFDTELEADAHDQYLKTAPLIEAYIEAAGLEKAQAGLMRKHLAGFIVFSNTYVPPPPMAADETKE